MPAYSASAPGKVILFGEHAVVYGRPAIAVPVPEVRAKAIAMADPRAPRGQVRILAPNIGLDTTLEELPEGHPLAVLIRQAAAALQVKHLPACSLTITSTIPIAGGMGSGAAVSAALVRALAALLGRPISDAQTSELVFQVEKIYHGTPSGIDNTVITYCQPVYFRMGQPVELLKVKTPFNLVIGDSGLKSPTGRVVGDLRQAWEDDPAPLEKLFDAAGTIAASARKAVEGGDVKRLGPLMDENHALLQRMGISCPELDRLVQSARQAGAWGAKLSGAGRGGSMIALVPPEASGLVRAALENAGAASTIATEVGRR